MFVDSQAALDLNRTIIRENKLKGIEFLDIGDGNAPTPSNYYDLEIEEIFN